MRMNKPTVEQIARIFGAPVANVRAQFSKNAAQLSEMADKAAKTGRKVNGYTEAELRLMAKHATEKGTPCAS